MSEWARLIHSAATARADVQSQRPLRYRSYVERVLHHLWRSAQTVGDPLARLSHRWPCAEQQELLRILRGTHGQSEGISVTKDDRHYGLGSRVFPKGKPRISLGGFHPGH